MPRPIILGVVGDSAAGKTTLTRGLVRVLGEDNVTHVCVDDYHRYDRAQRAERDITPLHPDCNYIDIMAQHLAHLRAGERDPEAGLPARGRHVRAARRTSSRAQFTVVEGLLGYHTEELRDCYDVRVFLAPPEELRRKWKVQRDCSRRGYTTDQVLAELDRREPDSAAFIRPQQRYADIVVSFLPATPADQEHLDAELVAARRLRASGPVAVPRRRASGHDARQSDRGERAAAHPRRLDAERGGGDRGDDLGADALREPPALRAPRRVHDRHRPAPLASRSRSSSC